MCSVLNLSVVISFQLQLWIVVITAIRFADVALATYKQHKTKCVNIKLEQLVMGVYKTKNKLYRVTSGNEGIRSTVKNNKYF